MPTNNPTTLIRSAAIAVSLAIVTVPSSIAQVSLFKDEGAREKLAELENQLKVLQGSVQRLASEAVQLNNEKRELLNVVRELSGLIEETHLISAKQNSRIEEIDSEIKSRSDKLGKKIDNNFSEIQELIKTEDDVLYNEALTEYNNLDFTAAEKKFDELLLRYPESLYAHAALFWLGSIQSEQNYNDVSKETLLKLITKYPNSPRVPDAIVLLEKIAILDNDPLEAKHWQELLLDRYPVSPAADKRRFELAQELN